MTVEKELYRWDDLSLNDAFDRTVVNIHLRKQESGTKTLLICGCEPKVGTTTIAINLAIAMANSGWKTVLIDTDMRKAPSGKRLSDDKLNLVGYLTGALDVPDILCATNHDHLSYISSGKPTASPIQLLCDPRLPELIRRLKDYFDYIIMDAPAPRTAVDTCILASQSDSVILVSQWEHTTTSQINNTRAELESSGASIMGIILNRMENVYYNRSNKNYSNIAGRKRAAKQNTRAKSWTPVSGSSPGQSKGDTGK